MIHSIPEPLDIGEKPDIESGFRVIANDTSSGRPWMWYAPDLEAAQRLAVTLTDDTGQDVTICKYVGRVARPKPKAEFFAATDYVQPTP